MRSIEDRVGLIHQLGHRLAEQLSDMGVFRTCLNCLHWDHPKEVCKFYNNQRPPAKVIVVGCETHTDEIPF